MFTLINLHNDIFPVHVEIEFLLLYAVKIIGGTLQIILIITWARLYLTMAHPNNTWLFIVVLTVNLPPQILEYFTVMQQMGIIQVVGKADKDLIFQLYNLSRVWTVFFVYFINISVALERLCAIIYLNDYERVVRPQIFFGLLFLTITLATCSSYYLLNELGGLLGLIACMLLSNFFAITMYWYAVTVTKRQHNQLFRRSVICIYSLSERYQIIENFRVFRLCKSFFISASTMNIFGCLIFIVPYVINVNDYQTDLWKDIFMAFLNIYAIPVLTCPIFADKEMRMIFRNSFPYFHIHRPLPHEKTPPKGPAESNEYFKMLNLQWN